MLRQVTLLDDVPHSVRVGDNPPPQDVHHLTIFAPCAGTPVHTRRREFKPIHHAALARFTRMAEQYPQMVAEGAFVLRETNITPQPRHAAVWAEFHLRVNGEHCGREFLNERLKRCFHVPLIARAVFLEIGDIVVEANVQKELNRRLRKSGKHHAASLGISLLLYLLKRDFSTVPAAQIAKKQRNASAFPCFSMNHSKRIVILTGVCPVSSAERSSG